MGATKIYSCYLHSTPTHMIVASFHALRDETRQKITLMSADCAPTRAITTASPTRLAETRWSDASDDVPGMVCQLVEIVRSAAQSWDVRNLHSTY